MEVNAKTRIKGISLIVLVITIVVIIILTSAIIMTLSNNNPITSAREASFKSNVDAYNNELSLYLSSQYAANNGNFDSKSIYATTAVAVQAIIKSMTTIDAQKFMIVEGKLVTNTNASPDEISLASAIGVTQQDYPKNELVLYVDGYDGPQNVAGTYYWLDKSGNNNNLAMSGFAANPINTSNSGYDNIKKAYVFDGSDDYMQSLLNIPSSKKQYTMQIVFKPIDYRYTQISLGDSIDFKWRISSQNPYVNFWDTSNNPNSTGFGTTPPLNSIYTFSASFDGTNRKTYLNNQLSVSASQTLPLKTPTVLSIGSGAEKVYGNIYSIRIYNRALSTQEIQYNYSLDAQRFVIM